MTKVQKLLTLYAIPFVFMIALPVLVGGKILVNGEPANFAIAAIIGFLVGCLIEGLIVLSMATWAVLNDEV